MVFEPPRDPVDAAPQWSRGMPRARDRSGPGDRRKSEPWPHPAGRRSTPPSGPSLPAWPRRGDGRPDAVAGPGNRVAGNSRRPSPPPACPRTVASAPS